jgi:hypothetical protein
MLAMLEEHGRLARSSAIAGTEFENTPIKQNKKSVTVKGNKNLTRFINVCSNSVPVSGRPGVLKHVSLDNIVNVNVPFLL